MHSLLLQNWITVLGQSTIAVVTQTETEWLDLRGYQDIVAWTEVKEFTPSSGLSIPAILYQTAPTKDDTLFFNMTAQAQVQLGVTTTLMLKPSGAGFPPCARWLRWQLSMSGGLAWDVTFRIWIAANRIGGRGRVSEPRTLAETEGEAAPRLQTARPGALSDRRVGTYRTNQ
jgi:hypothetical protein